jgi:hypothetical protein
MLHNAEAGNPDQRKKNRCVDSRLATPWATWNMVRQISAHAIFIADRRIFAVKEGTRTFCCISALLNDQAFVRDIAFRLFAAVLLIQTSPGWSSASAQKQ